MPTSAELLRDLDALPRAVFTTREVAAVRSSSVSAASQMLQRLARAGLVVRAARGVWCRPSDPRFSPFQLVAFLASSHAAYVSFFSALRLHGMIEQIPQVIYAATTAHTRIVRTPLGTFSFHQLSPDFFGGYDWYGDRDPFLVASREKAIVDCLYLSGRKGKRFGRFPDLDLHGFRIGHARQWVRRISDPHLRTHVRGKLEALWADYGQR